MINFSINNIEVQADKDETILEVARRNDIYIPTLCYHEALEPYGVCRLCVVEVFQDGQSRLVTACNYPVREGIKVITDSPRVKKSRQMILELLLARCPSCEQIRRLAKELGIEKPRFKQEDDDCILCGLCVRVCNELIKANAISFVYRGSKREVTTPYHESSSVCIGCGACIFVCPTGAIKAKLHQKDKLMEIWNTTLEMKQCSRCETAFVPLRQLKLIESTLATEELKSLCPQCRRELIAGKLSLLLRS